jgi:hypothetical protein
VLFGIVLGDSWVITSALDMGKVWAVAAPAEADADGMVPPASGWCSVEAVPKMHFVMLAETDPQAKLEKRKPQPPSTPPPAGSVVNQVGLYKRLRGSVGEQVGSYKRRGMAEPVPAFASGRIQTAPTNRVAPGGAFDSSADEEADDDEPYELDAGAQVEAGDEAGEAGEVEAGDEAGEAEEAGDEARDDVLHAQVDEQVNAAMSSVHTARAESSGRAAFVTHHGAQG